MSTESTPGTATPGAPAAGAPAAGARAGTSAPATAPVDVHAWLDLACPWCWVAKRRFEAAAAEYGGPVRVRYHSFELDPDLPMNYRGDQAQDLRRRYPARSERDVERMMVMVRTAGAPEGLEYNFDRVRRTSTFRAHQLVQLAADEDVAAGHAGAGRQSAILEVLYAAYFTHGQDLREIDVLLRAAAEAGIEAAAARRVLDSGRYAVAIHTDRELARAHGITSIPTYLIGAQPAVHGAKKSQFFLEALHRQAAQ